MVAFVTMVARWASQIFAFRNRLGNIKVKADQIYVPSVFVMTFALNAIFLTLSSYTALSKDNAQILGGYRSGLTTFFALSIIASLLVIILEIRLKKIEIARNLEALESKRSFVRYISHEVRTPLNTGG
jgi:signal transduction histidine kinase